MLKPIRNHVYMADVGHGDKPWLVVSNNHRNGNLDTVLAVRITTTDKQAAAPTVVPLSAHDPLVGWALCDDLVQLFHDELKRHMGVLTAPTMRDVEDGLRIAMSL
ncbi:type II toxin-antitoxin system PemK/MazF family toxin [Kineosporia rhizophila]|uniref:type II toxin-antitoxin system PemK/MazF family toxin n=1 Tax=Kineosporia TaxID=49184 RepID=UPI000AC61F33|nr:MULTISPECIES: type II toxin-antitoxin system PemK/MazF family toxin [Kineosporia]MCE0539032.1 type II toxin-antitoxin system PemK/MazF family toxin [Kineosporia rhizophila]GLY17866.1 endoribonuclease MazF1 [Kineosporia sp. NBRC 101677]